MYLLGKLIDLDISPILGNYEYILDWVLKLCTQMYTSENWWNGINFPFVQ